MKKVFRLLRYDLPLHFVLLLTNWLPDITPFLRFRGFLATPFFGSCGQDLRLGRNLSFYNPKNMSLGSHIYIAYGCVFISVGDIRVGDEVMVGPYVVVSAGNHQKSGYSFRYGDTEELPIKIGAGSWIGSHISILGGASVSEGCVIGSNAVLTRGEIPPHSFAVGIPAKVKKGKGKNNEHGVGHAKG